MKDLLRKNSLIVLKNTAGAKRQKHNIVVEQPDKFKKRQFSCHTAVNVTELFKDFHKILLHIKII